MLGEIVLLSGEQAGARARLRSNSSISISGNLDTDIVIRDEFIKEELLNLITKEDKVFLQVVSGNVEIDGKNVSQNNKILLSEDTTVKVGNTMFVHQRNINVPLSEIEQNNSLGKNNFENMHSDRNASLSTKRKLSIGLSVVVVLLTLTIITAILYGKESGKMTVTDEQQALNILKSNGFEDLRVSKSNNDQIVISGFVLTNKDRAYIEKIIDENAVPVVYDLKVGDQLAKEVRELYRINGVDIESTVLENGKIVVKAYDKDIEIATHLKDVALREIADLKTLQIEYVSSDQDNNTTSEDISYNKQDKRITMVVDGDPAYIMTSDHAKYYVGALLPEGYKVIDIIDNQVVLERKGKKTTMNF